MQRGTGCPELCRSEHLPVNDWDGTVSASFLVVALHGHGDNVVEQRGPRDHACLIRNSDPVACTYARVNINVEVRQDGRCMFIVPWRLNALRICYHQSKFPMFHSLLQGFHCGVVDCHIALPCILCMRVKRQLPSTRAWWPIPVHARNGCYYWQLDGRL